MHIPNIPILASHSSPIPDACSKPIPYHLSPFLLLVPLYLIIYKIRGYQNIPKNIDLGDSVVLITGAANGIGRHLSITFAKRRAKLVLADYDKTNLKEVKEMCLSKGSPKVLTFDEMLSTPESCEKLIKVVKNQYGKIDYLILNHAIFPPLIPWDLLKDFSLLENAFRSNVFCYVYLITHSLSMLEKASGSIVIMSSLVGKVPHPYLALYSATKYALDGFFGSLKREFYLQQKNVCVTTIYLGSIGTDNAKETLFTFNGGALSKVVRFCGVEQTCQDILIPIIHKWDEFYYPYWTVKLTIFFNRYVPWLETYFTNKIFSLKA